jgi:hypothetical protein
LDCQVFRNQECEPGPSFAAGDIAKSPTEASQPVIEKLQLRLSFAARSSFGKGEDGGTGKSISVTKAFLLNLLGRGVLYMYRRNGVKDLSFAFLPAFSPEHVVTCL